MKLIFFRKIFIGIIVGAAVSLVLLLLFSAVLSGQDDPTKLMGAFSVISLLAGAFVCGKAATAGLDARVAQGLAAGMFFAVLWLLPSVLISDFDSFSVLKMLAVVIVAFAGAMLYKRNGTKSTSSRARRNVVKRYSR